MLDARDLAGAVAAIGANPVDVDPIICCVGVDLEIDALAGIGADIGGVALDTGAGA